MSDHSAYTQGHQLSHADHGVQPPHVHKEELIAMHHQYVCSWVSSRHAPAEARRHVWPPKGRGGAFVNTGIILSQKAVHKVGQIYSLLSNGFRLQLRETPVLLLTPDVWLLFKLILLPAEFHRRHSAACRGPIKLIESEYRISWHKKNQNHNKCNKPLLLTYCTRHILPEFRDIKKYILKGEITPNSGQNWQFILLHKRSK